jgi:hypothetical protein
MWVRPATEFKEGRLDMTNNTPKVGDLYVCWSYTGRDIYGPYKVDKVTKTTFVVKGITYKINDGSQRGAHYGSTTERYCPEQHDKRLEKVRMLRWWANFKTNETPSIEQIKKIFEIMNKGD